MSLIASCGYEDKVVIVEDFHTGEVLFQDQVEANNANGIALDNLGRYVVVTGALIDDCAGDYHGDMNAFTCVINE